MNIAKWADRIIKWGFYLLFILVPLIVTPWNYELFEYNKMMVTYGLTITILSAWIVKMLVQKEINIAKTPLDIPIVFFVISQLVSSLFSMDPHVSWFGYYSRFNGGMWSVFAYVGLYYAFVSNFGNVSDHTLELRIMNNELRGGKDKKQENKPLFIIYNSIFTILKVALGTAFVVALYGVAEHFGIDKHLWVQDVQSRVFSTLGQPNWLAAYLVTLIPITFAFAFSSKKSVFRSTIYYLLSTIFFLTLLFTRSRSGYIALAAADIIFWAILFLSSQSKKALRVPFFILHGAFFIIVFINGTHVDQIDSIFTFQGWKNRITHTEVTQPETKAAGTLLESGGTESGTIRRYVWQGAINAWKSSTKTLLIGTGTETFAFAFYEHRPVGHNMTSEWDFLYNKAHNEYLNYLATTGIFGLGTYLLLIGVFVIWFFKFLIFNFQFSMKISNFKFQIGKQISENSQSLPLLVALFSGWTSILITNFFGFSVVIMQIFLFLFPALVFVIAKPAAYRTHALHRYHPFGDILAWTTVIAGSFGLVILVYMWKADRLFATGYRQFRAGYYAQAKENEQKAIHINSREPFYHDELASTLAALAASAVEENDATLAAELVRQSLAESDIAISESPNNIIFWKTRTKLYYSFSAYDPSLNQAAITALERAQLLSPNDPKIYYNLAILYGRQNEDEKSLKLLSKAKELKPDYRDAYFGLYIFYLELKRPIEAKQILQEYLDQVNPNDKEFLERIKN